jgi:ribosome-associated protein
VSILLKNSGKSEKSAGTVTSELHRNYIEITADVKIPVSELDLSAVRSGGPGGQNVNKVATAVQLRFDIMSSSLPENAKIRLLQLHDRRITSDGLIIIKAQNHRTQAGNRREVLNRFRDLIYGALKKRKQRKKTRPPGHAAADRLLRKKRRSEIKQLRKKIDPED